jgi:hypothetical protein
MRYDTTYTIISYYKLGNVFVYLRICLFVWLNVSAAVNGSSPNVVGAYTVPP